MQELEQTIDSREVAEMVEKEHSKLLRDIHRYEKQLAEANIGLGDFFNKSSYSDANSQTRPCYRITKKGCEFIAHKLTGQKGTAFTARYINRFHEMEDIITDKTALQPQENRELAELRAVVEAQGKILSSINRRLSCNRITGSGGTSEQEGYRTGIEQMIVSMNDTEALRKVYTFAKYVPK